jgi:hypothetical protein
MSSDIIGVLGMQQTEAEVVALIREFSLTEVSDSPPFRQYIGSKAKGIDLIVENGNVSCVQIYLRPTQGFSAYTGTLPLGIQSDMNQGQIHSLLGAPAKQDNTYSSFVMSDKGVKLSIDFDASSRIKLLSFMKIPVR